MFPMTSVHPAIRRCAVMVVAAGACAAVVGCGSGGHAAGHATPSGTTSPRRSCASSPGASGSTALRTSPT